jgi:8-oxo-dGTP pyrophosphatase MutT (NUDIX family)
VNIVSETITFATPWFQVVAKQLQSEVAPYYTLRMLDYVTVIAVTCSDDLLLVRQYRPALECETLELPSGHIEANETPEEAARRELAEECGYEAPCLELLGTLATDTGRHENRLWCYLARRAIPVTAKYTPETGVRCILTPRTQLHEMINKMELNHALNLAALTLAWAKYGTDLSPDRR